MIENSIGGGGQDKLFHVYTTGLSNWQSQEGNQNIIEKWNSEVIVNIIKLIPTEYKICFRHFDPLVSIDLINISNEERLKEIDRIKTFLLQNFEDDRVIGSVFIDKYLNLEELIPPYIILDFAHIFVYTDTMHTVQKIIETPSGEFKGDGQDLLINSVRFGFIGDPNPLQLAKSKIFEIQEDGTVKSYIDKMIEINNNNGFTNPDDRIFKFNSINPDEIIYDIKNKIIDNVKQMFPVYEPVQDIIPSIYISL